MGTFPLDVGVRAIAVKFWWSMFKNPRRATLAINAGGVSIDGLKLSIYRPSYCCTWISLSLTGCPSALPVSVSTNYLLVQAI